MGTILNMQFLDKVQNKMFGLDDGNGPKCCFCFPLKCGIIMIGVMSFIDLCYELSRASVFMAVNVIIGGVCIPALLLILVNTVIFAKYCIKDNSLSRRHLVIGCSLMVFVNLYLLLVWIA